VTYGGETYKTVVIGTQTWFQRNLNYEVNGSKCYDNNTANCVTYGRLYNWATAKTACPSGWHLPSKGEWATLLSNVQSNSLKATDGFSALPGGSDNSDGISFGAGNYGYWWSASEDEDGYAWGILWWTEVADIIYDKNFLFSVRCLKN